MQDAAPPPAKPLAWCAILAAAVRLLNWQPAPDTFLGGPLPLDQAAWGALATWRTAPWARGIGLSPPADAWLLGMLALVGGVAAVVLTGHLAWRLLDRREDHPWWWAPLLAAGLPSAWLATTLGNSPVLGLWQAGSLMVVLGLLSPRRPLWTVAGVAVIALAAPLLAPGFLPSHTFLANGVHTSLFPPMGKSWAYQLIPLGLAGPFLPLLPLIFVFTLRETPRWTMLALGLACTGLALWQARFLALAAPFAALALVLAAAHLKDSLANVKGAAKTVVPHGLCALVLLPAPFVQRVSALPDPLRGLGDVLASAREQGLQGKVFCHPLEAYAVRALSGLEPVDSPDGPLHRPEAFTRLDNKAFADDLQAMGADFALVTTDWLWRLPPTLIASHQWDELPEDFPVQYQDRLIFYFRLRRSYVSYRYLGYPTVYNLPPWQLVTFQGAEVTHRQTRAFHNGHFALLATTPVTETVNFATEKKTVPVASLLRRVAGAAIRVEGVPGMQVLGRLPLWPRTEDANPPPVIFELRAAVSDEGTAVLHSPYPTGPLEGAVFREAGPLQVIWEDMRAAEVTIPSKAVTQGGALTLGRGTSRPLRRTPPHHPGPGEP